MRGVVSFVIALLLALALAVGVLLIIGAGYTFQEAGAPSPFAPRPTELPH